MSVDTTSKPSIVPIVADRLAKRSTAVPTFTRTGTATRVNSSGLIETVTADIPRFDYNPVTLALNGLLIEEARTNSLKYSQAIGAEGSPSVWITTAATISPNNATSPAGDTTATLLTAASGAGEVRQNFAVVAGTAYALSVFVKAGTVTSLLLRVPNIGIHTAANLSAGTATMVDGAGSPSYGIASGIDSYGNGWYRVWLIYTAATTTTDFFTVRADTAGTLYVWGAQVEACGLGFASKVTSYIPTTTVAVQRGIDNMDIASLGDWFNASASTLFGEWLLLKDSAESIFPGVVCLSDGAITNRIDTYVASIDDSVNALTISGGVNQSALIPGTYTYGAAGRIAYAFSASDFAASFNGGAVSTGSSGSIPTVTQMNFGKLFPNNNHLNGHLRRVRYYDSRLSNADLVTLSGDGSISTDPTFDFNFTTANLETQTDSLDKARIGYHNIARDGTLVASSEDADFPADAAQRPDTHEYWKPTALPATWRIDAGSAVAVDYMAIAEHNLGTKGCSVKAQYSADNSTWYDASDAFTPDTGDDSPIVLLFSPQLARYWRLYISGTGSPATDIPHLAVIYMGRILTMQRSIYGGHTPMDLSRDTEMRSSRAIGGAFLGQSYERHGQMGAASFRYIEPEWYRENFDPFVQDARRYPFFFAWRPSDFPESVAYVWTKEDIRPSNMGVRGFMQVAWNMEGIGAE